MSDPDIILKLSNIESYYGPIMAIRGISLEVPRGRIVTLLGANGAGKTTVLKTISGILDPQKGSIEFLGKPIQRMEADKIVRLGLSHVPEGREVFPFLTVRENLMMGAYPRKDRDGVAGDLELVYGYFPRLRERLDQPAGQLSGGEQQMLAIGRALMNRPTLLLLDEPSLGPVADPGEGDFHDHQARQRGAGHVDPAGRAERQDRAGNRALRLRAGNRPRRHERHLRAADAFARTFRNSISAPRKRARAASGAGRRRKRGAETDLALNTGLPCAKDRLSKPATEGGAERRRERSMARPAVLTVADTIAKSFLLAVETRGDKPAIREKKFGIWQPTSWRQWLRDIEGNRLRAARDRVPAGRRRLDRRQRRAGMGVCRYGHPVRRRRFLGHLSDRFGRAGRISRQRLPHQGDLRRGRGAARQDPVVPRALPDACRRSSCSTWKA